MVLGSAVHEALAEYHRHLQCGQPVSEGRLAKTLVTAWERREQERPIQFKNGQGRSDLIEQGVALVDLYQLEPPPQNILAIEQEIVVPLVTSDGEFLDKPLVAVLDLLHREETGLVVNEFKTSGKRFSEFEIDTALQATSYAYAVQEKFDEPAFIRYTVLVRTKTPVVQRLETTRSEIDRGRLGDVAEAVSRAVAAGIFYPIESPMNCSGCPFRLPCREWSGTARHKRVAAESPKQNEAALC
jgi:CRISPR/Cas system-associated exonuclease Cas4 (RecB family)